MQKTSQYLLIGILIGLIAGASIALILPRLPLPQVVVGQRTRSYTLMIQAKDISVSSNTTWHAWTFNGSVPGPTLHATVGDTLVVRVINNLNLIHSFHTHLSPYNFSYDGSQANTITGTGAGAMINPGQEYTYVLTATSAGVFYYHCHSSDQHSITYHIHQGLYGAIIVDQPDAPKVDYDFTIFMGEMGFDLTGNFAPPFVMNGMGIPGGEATLMKIFQTQGLPGVAAEFNKTVLAFTAKIGETVRFSIVTIGDQYHSFHMHGMNLISEWYFPGRPWPANVIQLLPGAAESVLVSPQEAGVWLFHCHVVSHADAGMIGVFQVT